MNAPIKREDIKAGDRIRVISVREYISDRDSTWTDTAGTIYELIERPVVLPTACGTYSDKDGDIWRLDDEDGLWRICAGSLNHTAWYAPFTLLRPVAEVAAEVLADVRNIFGGPNSGALLHKDVDAIAAKFGVSK